MMPLVICTPYGILFLVRCPEDIRTECDIRLRDSQTLARHSAIGPRSFVSDLFHPSISPIPLLFAAPKGIGLKSNIRLSTALIKIFVDYVIRGLNALSASSETPVGEP